MIEFQSTSDTPITSTDQSSSHQPPTSTEVPKCRRGSRRDSQLDRITHMINTVQVNNETTNGSRNVWAGKLTIGWGYYWYQRRQENYTRY